MKRKYLYLVLGSLMMLIAIILAACELPGPAAQSAPDSNINMVSTTIAGTVRAAATQTAVSQPAETRAPGGMTGTAIEQLEGGSTKYTDYDGGFEVTYPAGWLTVRPKSEEFDASLAKEAKVNSMLHDQMAADQTEYDEFDRLYSYILRPDIQKDVLFGFSNLKWDSDDPAPLDNNNMGKLVRDLESAAGGIPGFRADTVQLHEDSDVKTVEIGGHWMMSDGQGGTVPFYSTILFFKPTDGSTVRFTFTYLEEYHAQISADILSIMESIKLMDL